MDYALAPILREDDVPAQPDGIAQHRPHVHRVGTARWLKPPGLDFIGGKDQLTDYATRSARDCLFEYLAAQPPRVDFGEHSRGEPERVDAQDTGALANAAIAYREARARAGIDISITQAVADVMAGKQPA